MLPASSGCRCLPSRLLWAAWQPGRRALGSMAQRDRVPCPEPHSKGRSQDLSSERPGLGSWCTGRVPTLRSSRVSGETDERGKGTKRVCNQRPRCCEGNGGLRWNWQAAGDGLPGTAAGGARSGGGASECKGRVVAHGGPVLVAQPASLKARPKSLPSGKRGRSWSWLGVSWGATVPPLAPSSGDSLQAHLLCEGLVTFLPEPVCLLVSAGDGLEE